MTEYYLQHLNNIKLEINYDNEDIIIWCAHDKNYKYGHYYKIDKDKNLYLVIEKPNDHIEILIGVNNGTKT